MHSKPEAAGQKGSGSSGANEKLDKYYLGPWRVRSEGWGDDLYLIDGDDKFHKIESTGHSNDLKNLWAGRKLTSGEYYWFGPRFFPFDEQSSSSEKNLNGLKSTINLLKRQNHSELKELSRFLQNKNDEELCEIIDVVTNCGILKGKLVNENKSINDEVAFNLERISESVRGVETESEKFIQELERASAEVFSSAIRIQKLIVFQDPVGTNGAEWLKSIVSSSGEKKLTNPFQLIKVLVEGRGAGYDCGGESEREYGKFFDECKNRRNEKNETKINYVIKVASDCCLGRDGIFSVPRRGGGGGWKEQQVVKRRDSIANDWNQNWRDVLLYNGIVDENCENLKVGFLLFNSPGPASRFCHEVNKVIFGNEVSEKLRTCTFS